MVPILRHVPVTVYHSPFENDANNTPKVCCVTSVVVVYFIAPFGNFSHGKFQDAFFGKGQLWPRFVFLLLLLLLCLFLHFINPLKEKERVRVAEWERDRERVCVCVCVCERKRQSLNECKCGCLNAGIGVCIILCMLADTCTFHLCVWAGGGLGTVFK